MKKITIILLVVMTLFLTGCTFQDGSTRDTVMGYDKGIIWYHAYLKNDHTTAYCFDNPAFVSILNEAQKNQKDVIFEYKTYLMRGSFCNAADKYETVVLENVRFADTGSNTIVMNNG